MRLIAFATSLREPEIQPGDRLLAAALEERGARVIAAPWNGDFAPFADADGIVIRSTWDYPENIAPFEGWLDLLKHVRGKVFNSPALMRWNLPKSYLIDLADRGAPMPKSVIVERDAGAIADAMDRLGLTEAVVKPIYGGTSRGLSIVKRGDRAGLDAALRILEHKAMVQPLIAEIAAGETSIIFFAGEYSHAVLKRPIDGEIRSQPEFGARVTAVTPPGWAIEEAQKILALMPEAALYARVDVVLLDGRLWLMEVEVIEPDLFFDHDGGAAGRFADILIRQTEA